MTGARAFAGPTASLDDPVAEPLAPQARPAAGEPTADQPTLGEIAVLAAGLALVAALVPCRDLWAAQVVLLGLLVTVPGIVLLRLLRRSGRAVALLAVPASVLVLLASGLGTDVVGGALDLAQPLSPGPLLVGLEIVSLALLAGLAARLPDGLSLRIPVTVPPPTRVLPLLLPVFAAIGAEQLNADRRSLVAVVCLVLGAVLVVVVFARAGRLSDGMIGASLYGAALASLWSISLRSESIFGFDLTTEFLKMGETLERGSWAFAHPGDAYGAMLSVTVLPVQLHHLTGISLPMVVKLVYPALFALTPVLVYDVARRFQRERWAVVAALIVMLQANFGVQMPQLARQEIALLLFAALLVVMVRPAGDAAKAGSNRLVLVVLMALGVVVTHYSTTYFSTSVLLVGTLLLLVLAAIRRPARGVQVVAVGLVALVAGAALWNGALTRSTANVSSILESFGANGLQTLPGQNGDSLLTRYLTGTVTPTLPAAQYEAAVVDYYAANRPWVTPLPAGSDPRYALGDITHPDPMPGTAVIGLVGFALRNLIYLVGAVGAVLILVRRRSSPAARVVGALALGSVLMLTVVRVSGTVAEAYNQDRALLNALFVLGPAASWCLQVLGGAVARRLPSLRAVLPTVVGVLLLAQVGVASSLFSALLNHQGGANIASDSEDAARQYVRVGELAGGRWLADHASPGELVYADRYGSLRFLLATGRIEGVLPEIVPPVIDRQAWVYASATNVLDDTARSQTGQDLGTYRFPDRFLADNFDVVYTNGQTRVYHGARTR